MVKWFSKLITDQSAQRHSEKTNFRLMIFDSGWNRKLYIIDDNKDIKKNFKRQMVLGKLKEGLWSTMLKY